MPDEQMVAALVDRIVAGAGIPSRATREDLRRELYTHFEEAGTSADGLAQAIARFGSEPMLIETWRRVYRLDYVLCYLAKVAASIVASVLVALAIELAANVRVELWGAGWRLAPGFEYAAGMSALIAAGFAAAWELGRPPVTRVRAAAAVGLCAVLCLVAQLTAAWLVPMLVGVAVVVALGYGCFRLRRRAAMLVLTVALFAAAEYGIHAAASVTFGVSRALVTGVVLASIWACTFIVLSRIDELFVNRLGTLKGRPA